MPQPIRVAHREGRRRRAIALEDAARAWSAPTSGWADPRENFDTRWAVGATPAVHALPEAQRERLDTGLATPGRVERGARNPRVARGRRATGGARRGDGSLPRDVGPPRHGHHAHRGLFREPPRVRRLARLAPVELDALHPPLQLHPAAGSHGAVQPDRRRAARWGSKSWAPATERRSVVRAGAALEGRGPSRCRHAWKREDEPAGRGPARAPRRPVRVAAGRQRRPASSKASRASCGCAAIAAGGGRRPLGTSGTIDGSPGGARSGLFRVGPSGPVQRRCARPTPLLSYVIHPGPRPGSRRRSRRIP